MVDITTVEEVSAGEYTVRVGQTEGGYEAVVIGDGGEGRDVPGFHASLLAAAKSDSSESEEPTIGPPMTAPHRWVAIGFAIEAYEWAELGEEHVDPEAAYNSVLVDGEAVGQIEDLAFEVDGNDLARELDGGDE